MSRPVKKTFNKNLMDFQNYIGGIRLTKVGIKPLTQLDIREE
jgi:hypothetical protein